MASFASISSQGHTYDDAFPETIIGLYQTEVIRARGRWIGINDGERATLKWVDWFNHRRLF